MPTSIFKKSEKSWEIYRMLKLKLWRKNQLASQSDLRLQFQEDWGSEQAEPWLQLNPSRAKEKYKT